MKIFALGEYHKIDTEKGWHWNGMYEAWKNLGHEVITHDIRLEDWEMISDELGSLGDVDILFFGLKEGTKFILTYPNLIDELRYNGTRVVYWFADLRGLEGEITTIPIKHPVTSPIYVGKFIDYIFLSNMGQIPAYKRAYGTDKVYYLPAGCSDQYHRRNNSIESVHDIAFAGDMNRTVFHGDRYLLLNKLQNKYDFIGGTWDRSDISTFYSMAKLAFVADAINTIPDMSPKLYSSDRLFIAGGCGACEIIHKFDGLELLVENHKHVVWWESEEEMFNLIDFYLKNDIEREKIRSNAYELMHKKHTHECRMQNMMNIITGKTEEFEGWL